MRKLGATLIIIGLVCLLYTEGVLLRTLAYIGIDTQKPIIYFENALPYPCAQASPNYGREVSINLIFKRNENITFSFTTYDEHSGLDEVRFEIYKFVAQPFVDLGKETFSYYFQGETTPQTITFTKSFSAMENYDYYNVSVFGNVIDKAGNVQWISWSLYIVKDYPRFAVIVENTVIESGRTYWFGKENLRITICCLTPEAIPPWNVIPVKFYVGNNCVRQLIWTRENTSYSFYHVFEKNKLHYVGLIYDLPPQGNIVALAFSIGEPEKETSYDIWSYVPIMSVGLMLLGLLLLAKPVKK